MENPINSKGPRHGDEEAIDGRGHDWWLTSEGEGFSLCLSFFAVVLFENLTVLGA